MSGKNHNNSYSHGIVCRNCLVVSVVRKYSEVGPAVQIVHTGTLVEIHEIDKETVFFHIVKNDMQVDNNLFFCEKGDILFVPENLWGPLLTVEEKSRLSTVQDSELAEALGNITVGNAVQVVGPDFKNICIGNVTFKNTIAKLGVGVYFGLKITHPKDDLQSLIKKHSLLQPGTKGFPRGCDIVVSVDKIRPENFNKETLNLSKRNQRITVKIDNNLNEYKGSIFKSKSVSSLKDRSGSSIKSSQDGNSTSNKHDAIVSKDKIYDIPLSIGDEVVYLSDGAPEKGTVRWLGYIKNLVKVGIEFDNPIGTGTGSVDGVELFKAKSSHAALMPPEALIKLSDFEMSNSKDYLHQQKTTNNNNCNNLRSNSHCCSWRHNLEDRSKIKINFHSSKYSSLHVGDGFQSKNLNDDHSERELDCNGMCKTECAICISQMHYPSRSFDSMKPNEKKIGNNRQARSMDNDLPQNKEILVNLQNSLVSMQKSPNKDLDDFFKHISIENEYRNSSYDDDHDSAADCNARMFSEHCEYSHPVIRKNIPNDDLEIWESQHSEQSSSDESADYYDTPKPLLGALPSEKLGKGSVVELLYKGQPNFGVIRWIGCIPESGDGHPTHPIAGIEMEEERNGFTDGTFLNKRYFNCNPRKALFVPLSECRKDSRFTDEINKHGSCMKVNSFGQLDCPVVEGTLPPINRKADIEAICGKNRGIQGHHNSCYLDATLFSMFAFTSVFDSLLYRPPTVADIPQYSEVQRVLKEEIVNPLRKNLYVRADRVMKLRTLLENLSSVSGLTCDEKDPEEFLNSLLAQILKAEPFLKLSSGQEAFHYQLFVEKDERLTFPSVQQLFEQSFVTSDIKLKQVPPCLIIQMPRFGKSYKMYSRIFPPQLLDVTDIIENSPRQCTVCGKLAEYECKDCFGQNGIGNGLESISFCKTCLETAHNHHCRMRHKYRSITVPFEFFDLQKHCTIPRIYMELFAVVCIETSHYVAFVKCGTGSDAPWCFFDSMADRKGEQNGYNIPEMVACPDLPYWLSDEGAKTLNEMKDERQLPEYAKRLLCDAYMCMYQSPDIMMYR